MLVLDRDLGLAVRAQVRQLAGLADLGEPAGHAVGERDRQRHQLGRLAAGEAEHHPLVAGAQLVGGAASSRVSSAASTPIAMSADCSLTLTRVPHVQVVEAVLGPRVADVADGVADDGLEVDVGLRRDLAEHEHETGRGRRLARHARERIAPDDRIEDGVADLVAHLVRMTLGHRLGREEVVLGVDDAHGCSSGGSPPVLRRAPGPLAG